MGDKNSEDLYQSIYLEPFIHQVGGRSSMLTLGDHTICKPLNQRELSFYKTVPESLKTFIPEFRGIIEVSFVDDGSGFLTAVAKIPKHREQSSLVLLPTTNVSPKKLKRRASKKRIGIEIECDDEKEVQTFQDIWCPERFGGTVINPWVLKCHKENFFKIKSSSTVKHVKQCILLENLTANYKRPCVLDLKMGTRHYDDDATLAKRSHHDARCVATTSGCLGVRICGMQVYQVTSGRFLYHNKYYGYALTVEGFRETLLEFLHDGIRLRRDVLSELLAVLSRLRHVVRHLDTFRFFTSSLLVVYDGQERSSVPLVDVRMVDFAHSVWDDGSKNAGPDEGYVFGLDNLMAQLKLVEQGAG